MMDHLAGAFAFVLWDKRTRVLLLATDHLGLRSMYYAEHNGQFRFASEVKGILSDPSFPHRMDQAAMADFFHFAYVVGDKTFFEDIKRLPPASLLRYQDGKWTISRYWDIHYPESYPQHPNRWYDDLIYTAMQGAVQRMANPDVSYALSLSGGMDSRWIAAFLSKVQPNAKSFTLGRPGSDDTDPALQVAAVTGLPNSYSDISPSFVADLGETYTYIVDGMYSLFCTEEFPLTVQLGNYADVSAGGFLGDCLFGHEINPVSATLPRQNAKAYWLWRNKGEWIPDSTAALAFGASRGREFARSAMESLDNMIASAPGERGYQVLQYINLRNRQPRFINIAQQAKLTYVDIYHPIADDAVVQAALLLPPSQLMTERAYRRALATYFPDLAAIPWTFTLTPPTISVAGVILKKAAQLTLGRWLRKTPLRNHPLIRPRRYYVDYDGWTRGALRPFIEELLLSPESNAAGLFDPDGLRTVVMEHMEGKRDATSFIGQALAVALWMRLFYAPSTPVRPGDLLPSRVI
jgi:asparagine synthetase B (glutamine-hydrolysing)